MVNKAEDYRYSSAIDYAGGVGLLKVEVWFVADFGTMGVNYLFGNGAVGLGDMLDNNAWGQAHTIE